MIEPAQAPAARRAATWFWLAAYLIAMTGIVLLVLQVRRTTLRDMGTPEAKAEWQAWRESEPNQSDTGPVKRRPPTTAEPPALILMRDHFPVVMTAAVLFSSLLFAALGIAARGVFSSSDRGESDRSLG